MTTTLTNQAKNLATLTNQSRNTASIQKSVDFMLKEDTFHLLLETGDKIVLQGPNYSPGYRPVAVLTNQSKS